MTYVSSQAENSVANSITLREKTKHQHQRLDSHPLIRALQKKEPPLFNYYNAIVCFRNAYLILEPILLAAEERLFIPKQDRYTPRLPALNAELFFITTSFSSTSLTGEEVTRLCSAECLSMRNLQYAIDHNKFPQIINEIDTSNYWGIRYVLDGSCHGAKMLLPRFKKHFGNELDFELAYWKLLAGLNKCWATTTTKLDALPESAMEPAINSAMQTFKCFIESLQYE